MLFEISRACIDETSCNQNTPNHKKVDDNLIYTITQQKLEHKHVFRNCKGKRRRL